MIHRPLVHSLLTALLVWGSSGLVAPAQNPLKAEASSGTAETAPTPALPAMVTLSNNLQRVEAEITALKTQTNTPPDAEHVFQQGKLSEIRATLQERMALQERLDAPVATISATGLPEPDAEPTVTLLDQLRTLQKTRKATQEKYHEIVETAVQEADYAKRRLLERQQELRALKELPAPTPEQQQMIRRLPLDIRLLTQLSEREQMRLKLVRQEKAAVEEELVEVEKHRAAVRARVTFSEEEYQEIMVQLDQREAQLGRQIDDFKLALQVAENATQYPGQMDEVRVLRRQIEALEERRQRVPEDRDTWEKRFTLHNQKPSRTQRFEWEAEANKQVARLDRLIRVKLIRLEELKQQVAALSPSSDDPEPATAASAEVRLTKATEGVLVSLRRSQDLQQHLLADLAMFSRAAPLSDAWLRVKDWSRQAWYFEITSIDERPVTVRKIVLALLLLVVGVRIMRLFSHRVIRNGLKRAKVVESTAVAISTLVFYALAVMVFVVSLGFAGIPLTLFTLLGGALAIGLGFGSQNIINNFISGLILLLERPIRIHDMVEVNGTNGKVIRVGLRCTQVRTFNNIDIMVPNSSFLESNVINWTLTDDRARGDLYVGIAYGSDTERAKQLLLEAAAEHPKILKSPAPEVMFMDFGDNALTFRMYVWVRMRSPSDRDRVLSDLRFLVDKLFREEDLVIAYPQRDVHLDTLKPLEVRLMKDEPPAS